MGRDYWRDRDLRAREALLDRGIGAAEAELRKQYVMLSRKISGEMQRCYEKCLMEAENGTLLPSDLYRFNRYYEMKASIDRQLTALGGQEERQMSSWLSEMYEQNKVKLSKQLGIGTEVSPDLAARAVRSVWCDDGLTFSERIWKNSEALKEDLNKGLFDVVSSGGSAEVLKQNIMQRFSSSYAQASRLVRTEMSHVYNQSTIDTYTEAGIERYMYLTSEDEISRKCPKCTALNHKEYGITEQQAGVNLPPMHPNCRCTTIPVIE